MTVFGMGCPSQNRREVSIFSPFFAMLFTDQKEKELSQINIHWHVSEILKRKKLPGNHNQLYQHSLI